MYTACVGSTPVSTRRYVGIRAFSAFGLLKIACRQWFCSTVGKMPYHFQHLQECFSAVEASNKKYTVCIVGV